MEISGKQSVLINYLSKRPLERPRYRQKDNIKCVCYLTVLSVSSLCSVEW